MSKGEDVFYIFPKLAEYYSPIQYRLVSIIGAGNRNRTGTDKKCPRDFKSLASACSAIPAKKMEATPGFEPGVKDLQSSALPLGYVANI